MSATNRGRKRNEKDFYITPKEAVLTLLEHFELPTYCYILEPGAGNGAILEIIKDWSVYNVLDAVEIREEERDNLYRYANNVIIGDFLNFNTSERYELIIGNPPYSLAQEFIEQCFTLNYHKIAMLLPLSFLASRKRKTFWDKHKLNKLYILSSRPSFTGDGKTDAQEYAWFIWENGSDKQEIKTI